MRLLPEANGREGNEAMPAMAGGKKRLRGRTCGAFMAMALALTFLAATSHAQTPAAPPAKKRPDVLLIESDEREAAKLHDEGRAALGRGQNERARDLLRRAFQLRQSWDIAEDLGSAELALREFPEAATHLAFGIAHAPTDANLEPARAKLAEARPHVAGIRFAVNVPDAKVRIDGQDAELPAGEAMFRKPGSHVFEAHHPDYGPARKDIMVEAGKDNLVELVLTKRNGNNHAPNTGRAHPARLPLIITGSVLVAAGVGTGIGLTLLANSKATRVSTLNGDLAASGGSAQQACRAAPADPRCLEAHEAYEAGKIAKHGAIAGSAAAGGVGVVLLAVGFALPSGPASKNSLFFAPLVTATVRGLAVGGAF
jgi:hypothetical protein